LDDVYKYRVFSAENGERATDGSYPWNLGGPSQNQKSFRKAETERKTSMNTV